MKKIKKIALIIGTFFVSALSLFGLVSCSANDTNKKQNLLDNSMKTWNGVFNQQISSNYKMFVTTNITNNVNSYMNAWNNFVSYYETFTKDKTLIIPFRNFTLYIYSYNLSLAKNYPITFSSNNDTFNCEFIWNLTFGIKLSSYPNSIYEYNLIITDKLINATMAATILCSWNQLINSKIQLYGGWYINASQKSIISDHLTDLTSDSNEKIQDEIGTILSLLNLNSNNLKVSNPSNENWISVSMFTPLSNNSNLLKDYLLTQVKKTYGFPVTLFKYLNFDISGFDEYSNKTYPLNSITNPDVTYFNELFNWLKKETNSSDKTKNA